MKKILGISIIIIFFLMFLVYAGVFRDKTPIGTVDYYFKSLAAKEGFLTYPISTRHFFDADQFGKLYEKYRLNELKKIESCIISEDSSYAFVQTRLFYSDNSILSLTAQLQKWGNAWLIDSIRY